MFNDSTRAIYLQIADCICDSILTGEYAEESRLPSVREYAASVEVNANTVMRTYDWLAARDIIYIKRGIGFFVKPGARESIVAARRESMFNGKLDELFRQLKMLEITPDELSARYDGYLKSTQKN